MRGELIQLGSFGPFVITAWSICLVCGVLLAMLLTVSIAKKKMDTASVLSLNLAAAVGAVLGSRIVYCLATISDLLVNYGAAFIPKLWEGGYTLYGAVLGGMLGTFLYAKAVRKPLVPMLDLLAPGAAVVLFAERVGEYFTSQGLGHYLEEESMQWFPLGVMIGDEDWGLWQIPVFMYEALAALILLAVMLMILRRAETGRAAECFLILLSVFQIFLESLREDEFIRFGFVRFNQLMAAAVIFACLLLSVIRCRKAKIAPIWQIIRLVLFVLCVGVVILIEFALDKSDINNLILYAVMAVTMVVMGFAALYRAQKKTA